MPRLLWQWLNYRSVHGQ